MTTTRLQNYQVSAAYLYATYARVPDMVIRLGEWVGGVDRRIGIAILLRYIEGPRSKTCKG